MGHEFFTLIDDAITPLSIFGGIALVVWASAKAKLEHRKLDMRLGQPLETRPAANEDKILTEMKAMRRQMEQMQSTGHQFDLSFDEALNRLEGRINRLETKSAVTGTVAQTDTPNTLRNGQSS